MDTLVMRRINPAFGILIVAVVTAVWVYQGVLSGLEHHGVLSDESPSASAPSMQNETVAPAASTGADTSEQSAPERTHVPAAWVLVADDRLGDGTVARQLARIIFDRNGALADRPIGLLDRVTDGTVARHISGALDRGFAPVLVFGSELVPAARAVAEARPDAPIIIFVDDVDGDGMSSEIASGTAAAQVSVRHWEMGALAGAAAMLAAGPGGKAAFLDAGPGVGGPADSFRRGASLAFGPDRPVAADAIRVARLGSDGGTGTELRALAAGLVAWGSDVIVLRATRTDAPDLISYFSDVGIEVIFWPLSGDAAVTDRTLPLGVIGQISLDKGVLLSHVLARPPKPGAHLSLGVAEGVSEVVMRTGRLNGAESDRLDAFRTGLRAQ